ncbi:helix-turn-helix domain-containing protein [Agrobacterium tumefaciens]|uniref:Helix-turn-helix domain-containing protein n=1 Tax=Agrobacterium tumefaciens TaxID=358 RepID=A0A4D7Y7M1_AGRTU|nr:helix-turn-helix domain-containing protein [Agrobacterium tumefaciens]QCL92891.1 helix-turn-helix domain-containing protein [Agrobacterium tumefaciens]
MILDLEDKIYTADEVADLLRLTNRAVIKLAKAHGCCSRYGRSYLFSKPDVLAIWEVLREPQTRPESVFHQVGFKPTPDLKDLAWMFRPAVGLDRREAKVLREIKAKRLPCSYVQIDRAGPRTFEKFIEKGLVSLVSRDDAGRLLVKISDEGRAVIAKLDKWIEQRRKNGKGPGGWE